MTTMDYERLQRARAKVDDAEQKYYDMVKRVIRPGRMEWVAQGARLISVRILEVGVRDRVLVEGTSRSPYWITADRFVGPR